MQEQVMNEAPQQPVQPTQPVDRAAAARESLMNKIGFGGQPEEESQTQETVEQPGVEAEDQVEKQSSQETQDSEMEVEFEGKTYRVPKEIKDAILRHSDYTRKTQDIAQAQRVISEREAMLQNQSQFQSTIIDDIAQLRAIDAQIQQYNALNWQGMDVETMVRTRHSLDQLKDFRSQTERTIQSKAGEFQQKQLEKTRSLVKSGQESIKGKIPGFDEKIATQIREYAQREGYTDAELNMMYDPRQVLSLYKAMKFDQLQASRPDITKRANGAPPVLKPGAVQVNQNKDEMYLKNMRSAKTQREKEAWAGKHLARKIGI